VAGGFGDLVRGGKSALVVLSLLVGAGAAAGAVVFRWLIQTATRILCGHADYAAAGHAANPYVPWLGRWFVVLAPVVAGLLYGPLVYRFAREARGHGVPEVMFAVARRGGRIGPQVAIVKALASALCIGGGGSVGREGPIVQIGSALGSTLGSVLRVPEERMRILVACGAAGGIAATFNAPLAGVFFAMELILRDFTAESFGVVVLASVTSSVIGRAVFGDSPFLHLPAFAVHHGVEYLLFAALGVLAGVVGVAFTRVLYLIEDVCDWLWRGPEWLRPAVGGLFLGGLLLVLPQLYGVGYPVIGNAVSGRYVLGFLVALLVGKMIATSLTIGIGGSGGVFAPSLFIGAMFGAGCGVVAHAVMPESAGAVGVYALIGMGAVFAGAARAPITAVIIMFELTGEYSIILPLMTAIVLSALVSRALSRDSIYTLKLRRRGIDLDRVEPESALAGLTIRAVLGPVPPALPASAALSVAGDALATAPGGRLPVVGDEETFLGTVDARAVADALATGEDLTVGALTELPERVDVDSELHDALAALDHAGAGGLPVLTADRRAIAGWITHQSILGRLRRPAVPTPAPSHEHSGAAAPVA
jgi:CIC family chloride channel protein